MSKYTATSQESAVLLHTITSFLDLLSPLADEAKLLQYVLESELPYVLSAFSGQQNGTFKISTTDPEPEIFIKGPIAAVWTVMEYSSREEEKSQRSRYYTSILLVKVDDAWKISMATRDGQQDHEPSLTLPPLETTMSPSLERLMHFAELIFQERKVVHLEDWALPDARFVRNKTGTTLAIAVQKGQAVAAKWGGDVEWRETFEDMTVRIAGGRGMIWMKYEVFLGGEMTGTGIDVLLVRREWEGERWFFDGTQTLNELVGE